MTRRSIRTSEVLFFLGPESTRRSSSACAQRAVRGTRLAPEEADELRLAKLLMEELGVNAEGVDVALHLRRRLFALELRARALARRARARAARRASRPAASAAADAPQC
jgi:hypothetical protein